jgi:oligogalacturonide lyase
MKRTLFLSAILVAIAGSSFAQSVPAPVAGEDKGFVGKVIPSEKITWIDEHTGHEITQWTTIGVNWHPYFTKESFIDDTTAIIISRRTGKEQLYKLDLRSGRLVQMTIATDYRNMEHLPAFATIWYLDGTTLRSLNSTTLKSTDVYDFKNETFHITSFSVTCDGRWFVFSVNKKRATEGDCQYGPFAIFKLNLKDPSLTQITQDYGFNIGHVQANPVDPGLIMYCWQWEKFDRPKLVGHAPIRIWWVNIDGTAGGPLEQEYGTQRTHETWTADGKSIAFVSKYRWGANLGRHFLGIQSIDGKIKSNYWAQVSPAHQNLYKDNKHWIVDLYDDEKPQLVMFTRGVEKLEMTEVLFRHGSSMVGQNSHPHPRFSRDGSYVLFSTDRTGAPQVYTVRVDLDSAH